MAREHLLSKVAVPEKHIHRIRGEADPEKEAQRYSAVLKNKLPQKYRTPAFDLVILGLGDDGHTASIFPYEIHLWDSKNYCEVATHPESGQKRITFTGKIINNAANVAFLVTGPSKAGKVGEILKSQGGYAHYPATKVAPRSGNLFWYLDGEAAKEIM
jgi:6-phosphogluconolactonase